MSDLYLVLRRRLDLVATEWVEIGTDVLRNARKLRGLSYESLARQIPVASKTWERWEKAGRVPLAYLEKVASLLDLEIEQPAGERYRVPVPAPVTEDALREELREYRDELREHNRNVMRRLDAIESSLRAVRAAVGARESIT
jgi:transcriptional regulator with XRE-family HTH domain